MKMIFIRYVVVECHYFTKFYSPTSFCSAELMNFVEKWDVEQKQNEKRGANVGFIEVNGLKVIHSLVENCCFRIQFKILHHRRQVSGVFPSSASFGKHFFLYQKSSCSSNNDAQKKTKHIKIPKSIGNQMASQWGCLSFLITATSCIKINPFT